MRYRLAWFLTFCVGGFVLTIGTAAEERAAVCRYCEHTATNAAAAAATTSIRHYAPDRLVDVLHIKLDVTPDFDGQTVAGTARLSFAPIAKPLTRLRLDGVELNVNDVRGSESIDDYAVSVGN